MLNKPIKALGTLITSVFFAAALVISTGMSSPAAAQPVLGAENTAMGSGGTAYLSSTDATFWNPANLAINDHQGNIHINLGHAGILFEPVLSTDIAGDQYYGFTDSYFPYRSDAVQISPLQRQTILEENYPRNRLTSEHQSRTDIILGAISWYRGDEAFSLAARARYSSRIKVGRGWYSSDFIEDNNKMVRDFTLDQHINKNVEVAFGYARTFTFFEGLFPRLSKLYVGFSPKFIIAGPSYDATYKGRLVEGDETTSDQYFTEFNYQSSGKYSSMVKEYLATRNVSQAINNNLDKKFNFEPTGYGASFNFGLTYLIPIGSDLNTLETDRDKSVVGKSLRIALSFNDIGMIRYHEEPLAMTSNVDSAQIGRELPADEMFIGSGGQYLAYFENSSQVTNPFNSIQSPDQDHFSAPTAASLNGGILLDLQRLKFSGDFSIGLNNNAFSNTKLTLHLGLEARPHRKIPLRVGTRLAAGLPTYMGLGTGFESRYMDVNVGTQIIFRSHTFTTEFVGGAFAGLQLHL